MWYDRLRYLLFKGTVGVNTNTCNGYLFLLPVLITNELVWDSPALCHEQKHLLVFNFSWSDLKKKKKNLFNDLDMFERCAWLPLLLSQFSRHRLRCIVALLASSVRRRCSVESCGFCTWRQLPWEQSFLFLPPFFYSKKSFKCIFSLPGVLIRQSVKECKSCVHGGVDACPWSLRLWIVSSAHAHLGVHLDSWKDWCRGSRELGRFCCTWRLATSNRWESYTL